MRNHSDVSTRINLVGAALLLILAVATGGSSQESGTGVFILQLSSLPLIAWVAWQRLQRRSPPWPWTWTALIAALFAIPLLQLAPLPSAFAGIGEARAALGADLARFGIAAPVRTSLTPAATQAALYALLPALAIFGLTLALPPRAQRKLAWLIMALAMAGLLLGILQLGAPQESPLNPYPQWQPAMNGFFANPNHQATLLVIAATLASAQLVDTWSRPSRHGGRHLAATLASATIVALALVALPLTGSRAGVILFILACATVVACHWPAWHGSRRSRLLLAGGVAAIGVGLFAALRWMRVDAVEELRAPLRSATVDIAGAYAPLGSGIGSYVPVFEQEAPAPMLMSSYVNHAHNEYVQWALEAGAPALLAMALGILALVATMRAIRRLPARERSLGLSALVALVAVLGHSLVDYPLRTPALLAVAAALAGIATTTAIPLNQEDAKSG